ncbi:MAG: hypothetical protein AB1640_05485 [bacterium]
MLRSIATLRRRTAGPLPSLSSAVLLFLLALAASPPGRAQDTDPPPACVPEDFRRHDLLGKIDFLCLVVVKDGKAEPQLFSQEGLRDAGPLQVDGYVCGVLAGCKEEMIIRIDGRPMVLMEASGARLAPLERLGAYLGGAPVPQARWVGTPEQGPQNAVLSRAGYALFPAVPGEALFPADRSSIALECAGRRTEIPVVQRGYREVPVEAAASAPSGGPTVRCLGIEPGGATPAAAADFERRLQAVHQGIDRVERLFGAGSIVRSINLLGYGEHRNALTKAGDRDVWFYERAFFEEPLDELQAMAEHEALHIHVERLGLTHKTGVRELFADLKGYDLLSMERFRLFMTGDVAGSSQGPGPEPSLFFAFIDERNFLAPLKGGHAHEDLDEFCTSFLHSLMFDERLEPNLDKSLRVRSGEALRCLEPQEKGFLLSCYRRTLETLLRAAAEPGCDCAPCNATRSLLMRGIRTASSLEDRSEPGAGRLLIGATATEASTDSPSL